MSSLSLTNTCPDALFQHVCEKRLHPERHQRVLDFCCRDGGRSIYLAQQGFRTTGADSQDCLSRVEHRLPHCELPLKLESSDAPPLPWATGHFDAVIAWEGIEYRPADELNILCSELDRVLRPGGFFLARFIAPGDQAQTHGTHIGKGFYQFRDHNGGGQQAMILNEGQLRQYFLGRELTLGHSAWDFDGSSVRRWLLHYTRP